MSRQYTSSERIPSTYSAYHMSLRRAFGAAPLCIWGDHPAKRYEWANVTGNYSTNIEDYLPMCPSCHRKFDYTEPQRERMRVASAGNHNRRRAIIGRNVLGETRRFISIYHAALELGVHRANIVKCLSGNGISTGKLKWEWKYA